MSDLSVTVHNLESLLQGKSTFNEFAADEAALIQKDISHLDATLQPAANLMFSAFKAGASSLVGAGLTAIGPVLAEATDTQATQVLNLLQKLDVPTQGLLGAAEQAALIAVINGLKAGLDRVGLKIATQGVPAS